MFQVPPGLALRQGDICRVDAFPRWTLDSVAFTPPGSKKDVIQVMQWDRLLSDDDGRLVCVCSYDCDLENPRSRSGVLLAPVMPPPVSKTDIDRWKSVMESWKADESNIFDHLNLFPLQLNLAGRQVSAVVDFSAAVTLSPAQGAVDRLVKTKSDELDDGTRLWFQRKLAVFVARPGATPIDPPVVQSPEATPEAPEAPAAAPGSTKAPEATPKAPGALKTSDTPAGSER